jgi:quercetin dioxygenase-like cupin family protein
MNDAKPGALPVRRVVTGHDMNQFGCVIKDDVASNTRSSRPLSASTLIWSTDSMPVPMPLGGDVEDMGARKLGSQPPPDGTRFIVMDFLPGASGAMHRTDSIDFIVVIEGEIDMDMEQSSVTLRAGDTMVQRGSFHAWVNRSQARARIAITLVDGERLGIGRAVEHGRYVPVGEPH